MNPDAGDYGVWEGEAHALVLRWQPYLAPAGCTLSLQRARDFWLQIDIDTSLAVGVPVAAPPPPLPVGALPAPLPMAALPPPTGKTV